MIVLDTNVISELMRPAPATAVVAWVRRQVRLDLHLTAVTEAELRFGAEKLPPGQRRETLRNQIEGITREDFEGRILPFDSDAASHYATIAASRRAGGVPIGRSDCMIAGIARSRGAAVATHDVGGFLDCGIEVINPWQA